jgi:hypothetical protein
MEEINSVLRLALDDDALSAAISRDCRPRSSPAETARPGRSKARGLGAAHPREGYRRNSLTRLNGRPTAIAAALLLLATPLPRAAAQNEPARSHYCVAVAGTLIGKASEEAIKHVGESCAPGDTIVIPTNDSAAVARLCDFTKQIVVISESVICSVIPPRDVRR